MKQLFPTNLIAVEVPEDSKYRVWENHAETPFNSYLVIEDDIYNNYHRIGNFKVEYLGEVTKEGIQFDVEPYLEKYQQALGWRADGNKKLLNNITLYENYTIKRPVPVSFLKNTVQESFQSLLQANNVEIPEGKKLLILNKTK